MSWLALTLLCITAWGCTDILYKKSSTYTDSLSHIKCLIWNGVVMAIVGVFLGFISDTFNSSLAMLSDNIHLIFIGFLYPIALIFGLVGKRHLDASVVSPLENIDGAMAAIILYFYFLLVGDPSIVKGLGVLDIVATVLILLGIIALGIQEYKLSKQELGLSENKKRHRLGALALLFPIIYNLVDALSMVMVGITVNDSTENGIPEIDFFIFESFCFVVVALLAWIYLLCVKKQIYNPFKRQEATKCGAAVCEMGGTFLFILAVAMNPVLTAPVTSAYCLVTIVAARIFLKEKLTRKQYICLAFLVVGIVLLGVSEIIKI